VLTVAEAIAATEGTQVSVRGFVVGEPISEALVTNSNFRDDFALALGDSPDVTDNAEILAIAIPPPLRDTWGLGSNPARYGQRVNVTGVRGDYFTLAGLTVVSALDDVLPDVAQVREYLGASSSGHSDLEVSGALAAEVAAQRRVCRSIGYPPDLVEALLRRVGRNLAARSIPLGVQAQEFGALYVGGTDPEIRRLEAPWRRRTVG
jgi:hypothetical protein